MPDRQAAATVDASRCAGCGYFSCQEGDAGSNPAAGLGRCRLVAQDANVAAAEPDLWTLRHEPPAAGEQAGGFVMPARPADVVHLDPACVRGERRPRPQAEGHCAVPAARCRPGARPSEDCDRVTDGGLLGDQQVGVRRVRPAAAAVVELVQDSAAGEVVERADVAADGDAQVAQVDVAQLHGADHLRPCRVDGGQVDDEPDVWGGGRPQGESSRLSRRTSSSIPGSRRERTEGPQRCPARARTRLGKWTQA